MFQDCRRETLSLEQSGQPHSGTQASFTEDKTLLATLPDQELPRAHQEGDARRRSHQTWIAPEITFSECLRKRLQGRSLRARGGYSAVCSTLGFGYIIAGSLGRNFRNEISVSLLAITGLLCRRSHNSLCKDVPSG